MGFCKKIETSDTDAINSIASQLSAEQSTRASADTALSNRCTALENAKADKTTTYVGSVTVNSGTQGVAITANVAGNAKFVCWLGVSSVGFIGSPYIVDMDKENTSIYDKNTESGYTYTAYYLAYHDNYYV